MRLAKSPLDDDRAGRQHGIGIIMTQATGTWSTVDVAGHSCRVFEPAQPSPHGFVVVYLHCSEGASLRGYPAFVREFEHHGLRVIEPVTGRSWWTDRIWPEFDAQLSAEAYVLDRVVPYVAERWHARPPQLALLGVSMGGQGALRMAYKYPQVFPTVAAILPAIDFQKRIVEGVDPGLEFMYRDAEDGATGLGPVAHPSAQLAAKSILLLRSVGPPLARIGRPAPHETLVARRAVRM